MITSRRTIPFERSSSDLVPVVGDPHPDGRGSDEPAADSSGSHAGVSAKVMHGESNKASSPPGNISSEILRKCAVQATRPRGKGKGDRRPLRFPAFRRRYAESQSYYSDVWNFLQAWGYRILNDLQRDSLPVPTPEHLAELFEARIRKSGRVWVSRAHCRRGLGLELAAVRQVAHEAAKAVLRDWSPEWIQSRREAGRRGGQKSRGHRAAIVNADGVAMLRRLLTQFPQMSRREQAEWLGWSESSLARVVRLSRNEAETGCSPSSSSSRPPLVAGDTPALPIGSRADDACRCSGGHVDQDTGPYEDPHRADDFLANHQPDPAG